MEKAFPGQVVQLKSGGAPLTVVFYNPGPKIATIMSVSAGGLMQVGDVHVDAIDPYNGRQTASHKEHYGY